MENYHFAPGWQITKIPLVISACFTALHPCLTRGVLVQAWTNRVDRLLFSRQPVTRYADIFLLRFDFSKTLSLSASFFVSPFACDPFSALILLSVSVDIPRRFRQIATRFFASWFCSSRFRFWFLRFQSLFLELRRSRVPGLIRRGSTSFWRKLVSRLRLLLQSL